MFAEPLTTTEVQLPSSPPDHPSILRLMQLLMTERGIKGMELTAPPLASGGLRVSTPRTPHRLREAPHNEGQEKQQRRTEGRKAVRGRGQRKAVAHPAPTNTKTLWRCGQAQRLTHHHTPARQVVVQGVIGNQADGEEAHEPSRTHTIDHCDQPHLIVRMKAWSLPLIRMPFSPWSN